MDATSPDIKQPPAIASKSGQRTHPRIEMPLIVEIQGKRYTTADWSLGGFGIEGDTPKCEHGDIFKCQLIFAFPYFETSMIVSSKIVRLEDGLARGFQFIDMTTDRAEVLSYIVDNHLTGELVALPAMLETGAPGQMTFSPKATQKIQMASSVLRLSGIVLASLIVLLIGSTTILKTFLTVRSEYASVASGRTLARAPVSGFIEGASFKNGDTLHTGDLLFTISPPVKPKDLAILEQEITTIKHRTSIQEQELKEAQAIFANWHHRLSIEIRSTTKQHQLLEQEVKARQRIYNRFVELKKKGITTSTRLDDAEVALRQRQASLTETSAKLERLRQENVAADQGFYVEDTDNTRPTPDHVRRDISESQELLKSKRLTLLSLQEQFVVRSPCDCTIETQSTTAGEYVESGSVVYALGSHQSEAAEIDALVPVDKVRFLNIGSDALVVLANHSEEVTGKVTQINYNPRNMGRTGLPDHLRKIGRFALVSIAIPARDKMPLSGLPATVTMRIPLGQILFHHTGIDWFISPPDKASS